MRPSALVSCFAEAPPAEDRRFFQALLLLSPVGGVLLDLLRRLKMQLCNAFQDILAPFCDERSANENS